MNTLATATAPVLPPASPSPPLAVRLRGAADALLPALAALVITVLLFSAAVGLAGFNPLEVWGLIVMGGFGDAFAWQNTLQRAAPLILTGLAVALPAQAGRVIIGSEGALVLGGLLGGWVISRVGLRRALWPLMLCMHLPNLVFVALAAWQPAALDLVSGAIALEQFGYGFGFTAYIMFMVMVAGGVDGTREHKAAHYAICTGFMALGMMLPGMAAGWLQAQLGYLGFFVWACVATLPSFAAAAWLRIDPAFGRKDQ